MSMTDFPRPVRTYVNQSTCFTYKKYLTRVKTVCLVQNIHECISQICVTSENPTVVIKRGA